MSKQTAPCLCPHSTSCPMYGLFQRSGTLKLWQINYCDDDFAACARFKRGAEGRSVPLTLLPNGRDLTLNLPS